MPNRLASEPSPYLQQHAQNPVDWYPWGPEAIERATREDKPIFLSVGYSACHWCHVMEHESFENDAIAAVMNEHFINVKVDREERPDVDQIYMNAVVALTNSGGWPMSVFLAPDLKPFFGGTYWPPAPKFGRPGFKEVLLAVHRAWTTDRKAIVDQSIELTQAVVDAGLPAVAEAPLSPELLANGLRSLLRVFDRVHGGFGHAPKFPHAMDLRFALRMWKRFDADEALEVVTTSLDRMARGGIYDHLGGGFARYSTDERWLVPHFEKMLYDNALLMPVYLEAFQVTGTHAFKTVVQQTADYLFNEMQQPEGGFYSTQDADSEGVEGKFFVWSRAEVIELLGQTEGELFATAYDVTTMGNWEHTNILNRIEKPEQLAKRLKLPETEIEQRLAVARQILFNARARRIAPGRDDKVLTNWNGLAIAALAHAGRVLGEPRYLLAAQRAADFLWNTMRTADGRLLHTFKDGTARLPAYQDGYAAMVSAYVELYQATFDPSALERAVHVANDLLKWFWDSAEHGFFFTAHDHETLIARSKDSQDNATPSGNSLAATGLLKLGRLTSRSEFEEAAEQTLQMLSGQLSQAPMSAGWAMCALDDLVGPAEVVVLVDTVPAPESTLLRTLRTAFRPNSLVVFHKAGDSVPAVLEGLLQGRTQSGPALFVCQNGACQLPHVGTEAIRAWLSGMAE